MRIEFRFLQLILSPVSNDRITLGLLHWDGRRLRVAHSLEYLPAMDAGFKETVRRTVTAIIRRAEDLESHLEHKPALDVGLKHIFPVRDGLGASLFWSPIYSLRIDADPEGHFEELKSQVHLDYEPHRRTRRLTSNDLRKRIVSMGEQIQSRSPDLIKVDYEVKRLQEYASPLSWKNGKWHHAIPFSLDGMTKADMDEATRNLYGIVQLAIPKGHVSVVLAVLPESARLAREANEEVSILLDGLPEGSLELQAVPRNGRNPQLDQLEERVLRDVQCAAE